MTKNYSKTFIIFVESTVLSFKTKKRVIVLKNMNILTKKRELVELNVFNAG